MGIAPPRAGTLQTSHRRHSNSTSHIYYLLFVRLSTGSLHFLDIAGNIAALPDILDRADKAEDASKDADSDSLAAEKPLQLAGRGLALLPGRLALQAEVEERGEDEGEAGDEDGADQLEDGGEARERLGQQQQQQHDH